MVADICNYCFFLFYFVFSYLSEQSFYVFIVTGAKKYEALFDARLVVYKMRLLGLFAPGILLALRVLGLFTTWGILSLRVLGHFELYSLCLLNCFKCFLIYILGQKCLKNQIRKIISSGEMSQYSQIVYIKSITQVLFLFSHLLTYSYFTIFQDTMQQALILRLTLFLSALRFLSLICQTKSLTIFLQNE